MKRALLVVCLMVSCGQAEPKQSDPTDANLVKLNKKYSLYLNLSGSGWIPDTKCDGLLFNSLAAMAGRDVDIASAQDKIDVGKWYRSPSHDCYPDNSGSTISRDMFTGLLYWIWQTQRLDLVEKIVSYGKNHRNWLGHWVMGEGPESRTAIRRNMQGTIMEMMFQLGGLDSSTRRAKQGWNPAMKGYGAHLQALHLHLRHTMTGKLSSYEKMVLAAQARMHNENAIILAVSGDRKGAAKVLLDERYFPADRLPTSADRCSFYIFERDRTRRGLFYPDKDGCITYLKDYGNKVTECGLTEPASRKYLNDDWAPCSRGKTHSGIDFLFAASLVLDHMRTQKVREGEPHGVDFEDDDFDDDHPSDGMHYYDKRPD